jgi:hypothetical protein
LNDILPQIEKIARACCGQPNKYKYFRLTSNQTIRHPLKVLVDRRQRAPLPERVFAWARDGEVAGKGEVSRILERSSAEAFVLDDNDCLYPEESGVPEDADHQLDFNPVWRLRESCLFTRRASDGRQTLMEAAATQV